MVKLVSTRGVGAVLLAATLCVAGCSSDDSDSGGSAEQDEVADYTVPTPEVSAPPEEGSGVSSPQPTSPLPKGYTEQELFVSGTATSFDPGDTPDDGKWTATPGDTAPYKTRIIVRRPPPEAFNGTVVVEWFNVSAIEASPDWAYLSEQIGREGAAYIGVSAQSQGVNGGDTLLEVEVDEEVAAEAGANTDKSGLKNVDPARYGSLEHPGDAYAFDIYSQVGRAVAENPEAVLVDLQPTHVVAMGESQSAGFLTTLVNAVHPMDQVYDGFLIHSRGASAAPLDGKYRSSRETEEEGADFLEGAVKVRTDGDEPVMIFETEMDLTLLRYANARQDGTDTVRTWEVAGTSHSDQHMMRSMLGGPRDPYSGDLLGCTEPINIGPHHETAQAALHHLIGWVAGGDPPPASERIEMEEGEELVIVRDDNEIAVGGVRTPLVDVPVAAPTGEPPAGKSGEDLVGDDQDICVLFGTTIPFDQEKLVEIYGTFDSYIQQFTESANEAVAAGFLVQEDADALIAEAQLNEPLFRPAA